MIDGFSVTVLALSIQTASTGPSNISCDMNRITELDRKLDMCVMHSPICDRRMDPEQMNGTGWQPHHLTTHTKQHETLHTNGPMLLILD